MTQIVPTVGMVVLYTLTDDNAVAINRRRTTGHSIASRIEDAVWPIGAQAHIGNTAHAGDELPMLIIRVWGTDAATLVNGQIFLDGNDTFWATSVGQCSDGATDKITVPGMWRVAPTPGIMSEIKSALT
jgi:hypothetical protein